jgi:hypothetical protein
MVQVPTDTKVTTVPETVHAEDWELNITASLELAVALNVIGDADRLVFGMLAKLIVWLRVPVLTVKDCTSSGAAE